MGPMTGRGAGFCAGYQAPGYAGAGWSRPFYGAICRGGGNPRRGAGRGFRYRNWFYATGLPFWARGNPASGNPPWAPFAPADTDTEVEALKAQAAELEATLNGIRQRLEQLTKDQQG